ncbi:hypothetical protein B566_EDAN016728, partial [Ephemera danica]
MAASSGGVEWTTIIKPILAATYGPFNKQDIPNFVKGIIKSEAELLNHEADYDSFYTAFSALAAESISSCADSLEKSQLGNACEATRILLQYLVSRLSRLLSDTPTDHGAFTTPQLARLLLLAIQGLCQGRSTMQYSDRHSLTSEMKVAKLPTHVKTSTPGEAPTHPEMLKRPRSDLTASVLEQLMTPLSPHPPTQSTVNVPPPETINIEQANQTRNESTPDKKQTDNDQQIKNQFIRKNIKSLKALKAGDKIVEMCLNLTHLSPYIQKCKEDNAKHGTCNSQAEALAIKQNLSNVLSDVTFITGALSLPVLEPLTLERISNLTLISRGCLSAAVSISTAVIVISCNSTTAKAAPGTTNQSRNEEEVDQNSIGLVEKSIEVFTLVSNAISNSKLAEKCVAQNHQMLGTAMLLQGLWYQLSAHAEKGKDEKGKSPSRTRESSSRINLLKIQQGFSILSVALASQALQLSASLMSDLEDEDSCNEPEIPVKVDIFGKYSPSQRVSYILSAAPIHQLLHYLAVISYRKAYTLKRVMKPATEEDTVSFSDSTIYNGDDFSFSDDSSGEEDEDSEPILGSWLEKTLATKAVPEVSEIDSEREEKPQPSNQQSNQSNQQTHQVSGGIVPEKGEPHGYITLATDIFEFLSTHFLSNNSSVVKTSIIANIGEQHMGILAAIIRDLDKESARTKTGTIPSYFGLALGSLYYKFSHFLTLYTHNLLATSVLSDTLQISLLNHLGVNPMPIDAPWPLMVYPRTLVALSQIIALKKQPEQETLIIRIWNRAINMLTECIVNPPASSETEIEDLNAEHAQLLLFFFYSLSLLQKKSVLLSISKALIRCGETIKTTGQLRESQLLHTARLLHIFEHLMRHLYDIPTVLVEQVKWNLFSATSLLANDNGAKSAKIASRMYCPSEDITDNLNKPSSQEESGMKPKFYSLTAVEMNHEETPKLDGLACNFILATPEKLKYPALIDALIDILGVINQCDSNWLKKGRSPNLSLLCAIQYCFMACWRMLLLLPPSSAFISQLGMNSETKDTPQLLYSLIWGPRTGCNVFSGYIKDNLVKQAMFTSNAETLLKTINSTMTSLHYTATLARNILSNFKTKCAMGTDTLQLSDLIILDVMVAKLLVHLHDQKSGQTSSTLETAISILPDILSVFHYVTRCTRNGLVAYIEEGNTETSPESQSALLEILAITSQQATQTKTLTSGLRALLPANVRSNIERWNSTKASYTPSNAFTNDPIPSECHILTVLKVHISKLYRSELFINNESLKHLIHALVAFTGELMSKLPEEDNSLRQQIISALLPTSLDSCSEYLHEVIVHSILDPQNEDQQREAYCEVLRHCYNLLINESQTPLINDKILQECLKIMETLLDSQIGCIALHKFFTTKTEQKADLIKILMSVQSMKSNESYSSCIHKFFNKLFSAAEKNPGGVLEQLCAASLAGLAVVDRNELCDWLHYLLLGQFKLDSPEVGPEEMELEQEESPPSFENAALAENQQLPIFTNARQISNGDTVATSILEALIPIGSRLLSLDLAGTGFSDVMQIMVTLANSGSRKGHTHLFFAATLWLQQWKDYILETRMLQQIKEEGVLQGRCRDVVEAVGQLLSKRQHLAVSHEKGKITVLQLSALLKQADSSKRKLTLTRLASAPIPFTVLSITGNPCNEDFLAVCGLKDCHVLTFSSGGTVVQHLVLHPQLETGNYIIRAIWLPGSQTQLALITADFIKIYDLSKDALSPQYYFLVPSGKIRDATFVFQEAHDPCLLVMSSAGYIYSQGMCEESSAEHGLFYVTNTLEVNHPDIKDVGGLLGGGGVSIYYSHTLQLLFFSFSQGKSFIAPLKSLDSFELPTVFQIQLTNKSSSNGSSKSSSQSQQAQPLCEWSEVPNHPGLVCSVLQASNNPVILMIKPDTVLVQEIKVVPAKAKILDMVAIRHASSSSELRTTLILLCEDGSLRIYMAGQDQTGYWLSPAMQASNPLTSALRTGKKKKTNKNSKQSGASSAPNFPVDFFEHCQLLGDIEYGGNDVLEVYNSEQIKTRLAKQGQYILNTRPAGFTLEINNTDISCVITGIRIFVGSQDPLRSPAYVEILGRSIQLNITSSRWFDYPLTREESLQADRKLSVTFGPSQDPDCVTMVDSILVYGKTKDSFGWPEESEEVAASSANGTAAASTSDNDNNQSSLQQMSVLDKAMAGILEVLDGCFAVFDFSDDKQQQQKSIAINVATNLLTLPTPNSIQFCAKSLLASLHSSKVGYHQFKDQAILKYVTEILSDFDKILSAIDIDSELFYRLVLMTRSIAAARPYNLTKIAETLYKGKDKNFMTHLLDNFWRLHAAKPNNIVLAPVCVPGLTHVETTVHAVVEIINAFTYSDLELVPQAAQLYLKLLLCEDTNISFSAKQALIRVLRPRQRQQPKIPVHCTTPPTTSAPPVSQPSQEEESHAEPVDAIEPIALLDEAGAAGVANPIEALLGAGAFPPLLDIPPESVDETMVELAIALSLQEHDSVANLLSVQQNLQQGLQNLSGQALQSLQALATQAQPGPSHEPGHLSDTTASAGGSDDEGSTAATDGSTLRTSPAEQGWESGGSGADSISCETFERYAVTRSTSHGVSPGSSKCDGNHPPQEHCYNCMQMKEVRLRFTERLLLEKLLAFLPQLKQVGGVQAIPFLQVILILTSDLEGDDQYDRNCLDRLLSALVSELGMRDPVDVNAASECQRTPQLEVHLVMMRFLSVLMSRAKSTSKNSNESDHFVSQTTASTLMDNSVVQYCLGLLKGLLLYWKNQNTNQESASGSGALGGSLLKSSPNLTPPDMSPFFLKLYVKGLGGDVFESYPQLLTEMALRLPYQVLKHADNPLSTINEVFGDEWNFYLCEYMMTNQTPFVRRQVRKLLMFLCGNKDKYRRSRDFHALECHTREIIKVCHEAGLESTTPLNISLAYDQLVELMEHLKSCLEIATSRPNNWQNFCMFSETLVPFLFKASCALDEGVCPTILQLLQNAFGKVQSNKEREKSVESDTNEKDNCSVLVRYITENIPSDIVALFIKTFLLETNSTAVRWQAHDLVQSLHFNSNPTDQETLKDLLWTFWPQLGTYGRKAAQFVDLLGYFSIKSTDNGDKIQDMVDLAVNSLKTQNQILAEHPNTNLYGKLSQFIELDGYYFETRSCLVCNNPEVPLSSIKLSAIKVDSKFTTTTQIVKLVSSHSISKITLRIGDLKRAKMVRSINIFYNNRSVQAVVELKNKPAMWNKAKKVVLTSGQTEVKVDFPLPIVACNLMIEYSDFYENIQASSETLQCPRCGVSVPANPGVCGNCGENVFQCHKCRAINYDEKDPFLCHSCGFCKYAKFEYTLTARPCCAVDPIENDEDRKKTLNSISTMQERADRIYKQLSTIRPNVEVILQSIEEGQGAQEEGGSTGSSNSTHVKQRINLLAQRYCVDCKSSFEELGKI